VLFYFYAISEYRSIVMSEIQGWVLGGILRLRLEEYVSGLAIWQALLTWP